MKQKDFSVVYVGFALLLCPVTLTTALSLFVEVCDLLFLSFSFSHYLFLRVCLFPFSFSLPSSPFSFSHYLFLCVSLSLTHKKEIIRSQGNLSSLSLALEKLPLKMDRGPLVQPPLPLLFLTSFRIHISRNSFYNTARVGVMRCCSVPVTV